MRSPGVSLTSMGSKLGRAGRSDGWHPSRRAARAHAAARGCSELRARHLYALEEHLIDPADVITAGEVVRVAESKELPEVTVGRREARFELAVAAGRRRVARQLHGRHRP